MIRVVGLVLLVIVVACVAAILSTYPAMLIWNAYVVPLFHGPVLNFWQSFWLLFLVRLITSQIGRAHV